MAPFARNSCPIARDGHLDAVLRPRRLRLCADAFVGATVFLLPALACFAATAINMLLFILQATRTVSTA